jgi:lipoprotein-anchoring transpeptidase ErfK/SrfK
MYKEPVSLHITEQDQTRTLTISPAEVKKISLLTYYSDQDHIDVQIDDNQFYPLINNYLNQFKFDNDRKIYTQKLRNDMLALLQSRSQGVQTNILAATVALSPNTYGEKARKYIEVDISQQRMYLFLNGQPYATYGISSGLYDPTPRGEFTIINKATNAYSDIYDVWMPYWMGFYYHPTQKAYYGIHELPYKLTSDGQKIQRPREFIGSPHTGGCVALDIGASKEVYNFAEVGMPVYVFD